MGLMPLMVSYLNFRIYSRVRDHVCFDGNQCQARHNIVEAWDGCIYHESERKQRICHWPVRRCVSEHVL